MSDLVGNSYGRYSRDAAHLRQTCRKALWGISRKTSLTSSTVVLRTLFGHGLKQISIEPCHEKTCLRAGTNRAVETQKMARGLEISDFSSRNCTISYVAKLKALIGCAVFLITWLIIENVLCDLVKASAKVGF